MKGKNAIAIEHGTLQVSVPVSDTGSDYENKDRATDRLASWLGDRGLTREAKVWFKYDVKDDDVVYVHFGIKFEHDI